MVAGDGGLRGEFDAVRYFVRNDDVGELTDALRHFVETFVERNIPVSYQIIPAQFTRQCADFLLMSQRAHRDLIEFGQHGLHHRMEVNGRILNREFGPERTYDQQFADISTGLRILEERLGSREAIKVFTPPQHKYDRNTVLAVAAAGHKVFSAAYYASANYRIAYALGRSLRISSIQHHGISYDGRIRPEAPIFERSIAIAVDDGERIVCSPEALPRALTAAGKVSRVVGLMFHHPVYDGAAGRSQLGRLADHLASVGASRFGRLGQLAV